MCGSETCAEHPDGAHSRCMSYRVLGQLKIFMSAVYTRARLQVNPEELSRCLFTFTRLAYKPSKLLDSIDSCLPHSAHVLGDVHCAVKVSLCIAAFDMDLPRLHAWTMKVLSQMQASQFPTSELVDQAVTAHKIGKHRGCAFNLSLL